MTREGELLNDSGDKASPKRDRSRKRAPRMTPVEMGVARVTPAAMTRVLPTLVLAAFAWLGCGSGDSGGSGEPGSSAQPRSSASMAEPPRNVRVVVLETSDLTETMTINFFGADTVQVAVWGLLLLTLFVRPQGLFGHHSIGKGKL